MLPSALLGVVITSALALAGTRLDEDEGRAPSQALEPTSASASVIRAFVSVEDVAWGTRVTLSYDYGDSSATPGSLGQRPYALRVRTLEGPIEEVATWSLAYGHAIVLEASTSVRATDIVAIEMGPQGGPVSHRTTIGPLDGRAGGRGAQRSTAPPPGP